MNDVAEDVREDLALVTVTDDEPVAHSPSDDATVTHECEHCGHCPCGCGG